MDVITDTVIGFLEDVSGKSLCFVAVFSMEIFQEYGIQLFIDATIGRDNRNLCHYKKKKSMMFVGDAKLLGLKRKRCSRKIISFDAASHHSTVDYYTVTASPVMFYSVRVTLCGDTRQGCTLSYFLLGI